MKLRNSKIGRLVKLMSRAEIQEKKGVELG